MLPCRVHGAQGIPHTKRYKSAFREDATVCVTLLNTDGNEKLLVNSAYFIFELETLQQTLRGKRKVKLILHM